MECTIPANAEFANADLHEAAYLQRIVDLRARSEEARLCADKRRAELLDAGQSFVSETVFSDVSIRVLIKEAQGLRRKSVRCPPGPKESWTMRN